jgi:transcriptional regulator with XRE-family HTH domain
LKSEAKKIGKRLQILREHSELSRKDFGKLFHSGESTVYHWEHGYCTPKLVKLIHISMHFGVTLDCLLCGRAAKDDALEKQLCETAEPAKPVSSYSASRMTSHFNALPSEQKERLIGYLDALSHEKRR